MTNGNNDKRDRSERTEHITDNSDQFTVSEFTELIPNEYPDQCPDCGGQLSASSVAVDIDGDPTAVRLVCKSLHDGLIATYRYTLSTGEITLVTETEPIDPTANGGETW